MEQSLNLAEKLLVIRYRLNKEGVSIEQKLGITRQTVSNYICGKIGSITRARKDDLIALSNGWISELDFVSCPSLGGTTDASDTAAASERVEKKRRGRPAGAKNKVVAVGTTEVSPSQGLLW